MNHYWFYILLGGSALLGGLLPFLVKTFNKDFLKLLLAFSGAYLLAICFLHLIPEIYSKQESTIGIYLLLGFFLQILLEFFSQGLEHGHAHVHHKGVFPLTIMLGLCIHSFFEGLPLSESFYAAHQETTQSLLLGILLHKVPIAIVLVSLLLSAGIKRRLALLGLVVFALMAPLGMFVSQVLGNGVVDMESYFNPIIAVVVGLFLHVATTILFESSEKHSFHYIKFVAIVLGVGLALLGS